MGYIATYLKNKLLDHAFGGGDFTRPTPIYARLTTTATVQGTPGTEVTTSSWTNYAPLSIDNNTPGDLWADATGGAKASDADLTWPTATVTGANVTVVGIEFWDASSGGNQLLGDDLPSIVVQNNTTLSVASGSVTVTLSDP